jgi:hypothetical protein
MSSKATARTNAEGQALGECTGGNPRPHAKVEQAGRLPGAAPGPHSDVYGFARTCCYALFGTVEPLPRHWRGVPGPLAALLEGCLAWSVQERLADFAAVLERLEPLSRPGARRRPASAPRSAPAVGAPRPATAQAGAEEPGGGVAPVVGFMGTGDGMTRPQTAAVLALLQKLGASEAHHGDSKGAEVQFHGLCLALGLATVVHPPQDEANRGRCQADRIEPALPYRERNHRIVDATHLLVMAPRQQSGEVVRSGTWETVRYARGLGRRIFIVRPDGSRQEENGPAGPGFERFFLDGRAADGRLRLGMAGAACRNVRTALRLLGHALEEGDEYDEAARREVLRFQVNNRHVNQDGVCGRRTRSLLVARLLQKHGPSAFSGMRAPGEEVGGGAQA